MATATLDRFIARAEVGAGILITAVVGFFHWLWSRHAGALWRDEVVSFYVATKPSLAEMWSSLKFDSFPGLLHLVVRGWVGLHLPTPARATPAASTDAGLRILGLLVGLTILGALWWNARILGLRSPLVSLAIFAMNPLTIWTTDSLRSYGLGILMTLVAFGGIWKVVETPTAPRIALATLAAILSVHCLYQNAFFLLAICTGGFVVAIRRRWWRKVAIVVAIGAAAAVSLIPYRGIIHEMGELRLLLPKGLTFGRIWTVLTGALSAAGGFMLWVWLGLFVAGLAAALVLAIRSMSASGLRQLSSSAPSREDLLLYAGTVLVLGSLGYLAFLKILAMQTEAWYYVPPMALAAICLEGIVGFITGATARVPVGSSEGAAGISVGGASREEAGRPGGSTGRVLRLCTALVIASFAAPAVWRGVHVRQTNVDLVASQIEKEARSEDMIIVYPWFCGATFSRYYEGDTFWTTLPPHADLKLQRLDLLRVQMIKPAPIQPILERVANTLAAGHRVFLVGGLPLPPPGQAPPRLPPAPNETWGWEHSHYVISWAMQAGDFIRSHALHAEKLPGVTTDPVNPYENLEVYVVQGWRPS